MERTLVKVDVGACRCPGRPHESDWVELSPELTITLGSAAYAAIRAAGSDDIRLQGLLGIAYVQFGVERWSFVNEDGNPIRVDHTDREWLDTVNQLLPWGRGGKTVAEKADELYSQEVLRPLMSRLSMQSQGGPTVGSTSPTRPTGAKPRKRSRSSSRTGMAGPRSV